eukprot:tig00000248_g21802.t1
MAPSRGAAGAELVLVLLSVLAASRLAASLPASANSTSPSPAPTRPPPLPFTPRNTWTLLSEYTPGRSPQPRRHATLTLVDKNCTVLFGGRLEERNETSGETFYMYFNDVWLYNMTSNEWTELFANYFDALVPEDHPAGRFGHGAAALDRRFLEWDLPASGAPNFSLIVYGGASPLCFDFCSDMWEFRLDTRLWRKLPPSAFRIRSDGSDSTSWLGRRWRGIMWSYKSYVFVYGGFRSFNDPDEEAADRGYLNDLWELDFHAGEVLDADGRRMVRPPAFLATRLYPAVSGGYGLEHLRRTGSAYAFHPEEGLILFGGYKTNSSALEVGADSVFYDDLWAYDHATNTWYPISTVNVTRAAPTARADAVMFLHDEVIGIYGGMDRLGVVGGDTWFFNTTTGRWLLFDVKDVSTPGPSPGNRTRHTGLTFLDHRVLVFGGNVAKSEEDEGDLWLMDLRACKTGCSGYGRCYKGHCVCEASSYLSDCSGTLCPDASCYYNYDALRQVCTQCTNGRGICDGRGSCVCQGLATGLSCELTFCLADCRPRAWVRSASTGQVFSNGQAPYILKYGRIQNWDRGDFGPYANGVCEANGTCTCEPGWTGLDCSYREGCMDKRASNYEPAANATRLDLCAFPPSAVVENLIPIEAGSPSASLSPLSPHPPPSISLKAACTPARPRGGALPCNKSDPLPLPSAQVDVGRVAVLKLRRGSVLLTFGFTELDALGLAKTREVRRAGAEGAEGAGASGGEWGRGRVGAGASERASDRSPAGGGGLARSRKESSKVQLSTLSALRLTAAFKRASAASLPRPPSRSPRPPAPLAEAYPSAPEPVPLTALHLRLVKLPVLTLYPPLPQVKMKDAKEFLKLQNIFNKYSNYLRMLAISTSANVAVSMPQTPEGRAAETLEREDFLAVQPFDHLHPYPCGVLVKTTSSQGSTQYLFIFAFVWLGVLIL